MKPREMLLNLLQNYERIYVENVVLKTMFSTVGDQRVRETWEQALQQFSSHPTVADLHSKFAALRAQVSEELNAVEALDILLKMPTKGPVN
jgi:hypothetical protein